MEKASAMLAVLACLLAAFVAPFASADDTAADAAQLPDHIVNGDFEYHSDITCNSWVTFRENRDPSETAESSRFGHRPASGMTCRVTSG